MPGTVLEQLAQRKLICVTGKGGVGKTTASAALSLALAARGHRVLLALCNTNERLSSLFERPALGSDISLLSENVWAVNMHPEDAIEEYGRLVLKVRTLVHLVFGNKYARVFFRAVPGLYAWAMLGKAWYHATEVDPYGEPRFDVVVLDAPATGHGLDMLRVPKVIVDIVPPGVLRRDAEAAWKFLTDPESSSVLLVTLAEELPASETEELAQDIRTLGLHIGGVVVNQVYDGLFSTEERALLFRLQSLEGAHANPGAKALSVAATRAAEEHLEGLLLPRFSALGQLVRFPPIGARASRHEGIRELAKRFEGDLFPEDEKV